MSTARTQESFFFRALQPGDREQRARMLEAVTRAVAAKGFARVTVSDVVGLAGVSRRTFYEEFTDKEDCFLAAFAAGGEVVRAEVERAIAEVTDGDWRTFLRVSLEAYLNALATEPEFARTLKIDVLGTGPEAIEVGQQVRDRFVGRLRDLNSLASAQDPRIGRVPTLVLRALVGGIAELVEWHILREGAESLGDLAPQIVDLATAVIEDAGVR
jgi:AcrR family transcriptional regulator